jgi:hypothetical protein
MKPAFANASAGTRFLIVVLVVAAIGAGLIAWTLPPRALALLPAPAMAPSARGALHVHTRRSDGSGTADSIAAAASRAGLTFVILTDHADASTQPDPPAYRHGVLMIDAAEISTDAGHIVALGLPKAPYPLAGEGRDVLGDIRRLGGFAIAAHPASPKPELRWLEWTSPLDGLEWLNVDSEWRDESARTRAQALSAFPFRQPETLATLLDRPDTTLLRWNAMTARRRVVAVAAGDAHARIELRRGSTSQSALALPLPAYESMFRTVSITVSPVSLTGDAAADARAVIDGIRAGHVYSSVDALAAPAALSFTAVSEGSFQVTAGDVAWGARQIELRVETNAPDNARIVLLKNGQPLTTAAGKSLAHRVSGARAVYRTEVHLPGAPGDPAVPWILSNPIYVGFSGDALPPTRPEATEFASLYDNGPAGGFVIEASRRSAAAIDVVPATGGGTQLSVRWALGGTLAESPYAAVVMPAGPALSGYDRVTFTARADRQMRLSVQLRVPTDGGGERWHRSVYLDETPRAVTVFFDEMTPRGVTSQRRPVLSTVRDVLFVIDTVNTKPGTSGVIWLDDVKYGK